MVSSGLKNFSDSVRLFLFGPGKYTLLITLFYSLCLVRLLVVNHDFELHSLNGRMLGIATLEGYDVSSRVSLFYKSIALFFVSMILLNVLSWFIHFRFPLLFDYIELQIGNYCAFAGMLFLLFDAFGYKEEFGLQLIFSMHEFMLAGLLIKRFFFRDQSLTVHHYTLTLMLSFGFYFFLSGLLTLLGAKKFPDFLIFIFSTSVFLSVIFNLIIKKKQSASSTIITRWAYVLVPVLSFPLVLVLKDEAFLVLKNNGQSIQSAGLLFLGLSVLVITTIFFRYRKAQKRTDYSLKQILSKQYAPLLIFSLFTFTYYGYTFNFTGEIFEAANKYLAVMEWKLFGVVPTFEKFNSHLLSDYFYSGIYTLLNGLQGSEMELYDFLNTSISYLLYYYLLLYITRNFYVSLFALLLFPLTQALMPEPYAFGIFALMALHRVLYRKASFGNYLIFFYTLAFLILWRIDLGYACVIISPLILLLFHLFTTFKINWRNCFLSAAVVFASLASFVGILSLYRHINLFGRFKYTLNYLSSAQTYGYSSLGDPKLASYNVHYYVFPVLAGLTILALFFLFRSLHKSKKQKMAFLSLLFLCAFYLMNFNRGLVRHSLIEWVDHFTSSFAYFALSAAVFVFFYKRSLLLKYSVFCLLAFFLLTSYKLPDPRGSKTMVELCQDKIKTCNDSAVLKIHSRVKNLPTAQENPHRAFIDFISKNTSPKETFIDFSNNPMLYFYTKKITPSFFYQNPACSHNDFLQKRFIEDLKNYNTPYLVFSRTDYEGRDFLDGVPNTLRHYRMAEYFYQNYKPYAIVGPYRIWRNKALQTVEPKVLYSAKKHPGVQVDSLFRKTFTAKTGKQYLVRVILSRRNETALKIDYQNSYEWIHMDFVNEQESFSILEPKEKTFTVNFAGNPNWIEELQVLECDYIPDYYAEKYTENDFMKLPYIWGNDDKLLHKEPLLFKKDMTVTLKKEPQTFGIPETLDKTSGNTVQLVLSNTSKKKNKVTLSFGNRIIKNSSKIIFELQPLSKQKNYAIRASSVYKWYSEKVRQLGIFAEDSTSVTLHQIKISKGM